MRITCPARVAATGSQIAAGVQQVLDRRASMARAPVTLAVSDAVALGIAGMFVSRTESGQLLDRFSRGEAVGTFELLEAVRFEQGYASPEDHAALYCLAGWVQAHLHKQGRN